MAVATELKNGVNLEKVTKLEFPIFPIAAAINWDSGIIKQQLKSLEWTKGNNKFILLLGVWLEAWLQYGCRMILGKYIYMLSTARLYQIVLNFSIIVNIWL